MHSELKKLYKIRRCYEYLKLKSSDLTLHPIDLFKKWLNDAYKEKIIDFNAMCLSTVYNNMPYQRIVLLKYFDYKNMLFVTNMQSRKSLHLDNNPHISLLFHWNKLERQVMILGIATKISIKKAKKYFYSRPKNSQISAWVSQSFKIIKNRNILKEKFLHLKKVYKYKKVPFPQFWGGYKVKIKTIEFWQGGKYRLHDRFIYELKSEKWKVNRLSP